MNMKKRYSKEVCQFIKEFSQFGEQVIRCFTDGNCYWFAYILHTRFPESKIMINNVQGHFACSIDDKLYDITGGIGSVYDERWEDWYLYQKEEPTHSKRIKRDCIDKEKMTDV